MSLFWWSGWALATLVGILLFALRSAEGGFVSVSLPKLLYMMWLMTCVLILVALRLVVPACVGLAAALLVGALAFAGEEADSRRRKEVAERLRGARAALAEHPNNGMSMELLGDVCSTLEEREPALAWYRKAYALVPNARLQEKIAGLERKVPLFYIWGNPCAHELRLCPGCEELNGRADAECRRCGRPFFATRALWAAAALTRVCDETGLTEALESGLLLLPFLYACGPGPYGLVWLVWAGARRPRSYGGAT
jgi:hypothetical protein